MLTDCNNLFKASRSHAKLHASWFFLLMKLRNLSPNQIIFLALKFLLSLKFQSAVTNVTTQTIEMLIISA